MDEPAEIAEDAPLTADEILTFGPVVESVVWTPMWVQESRAPIAVAAGRAKLGKVFDDNGVGTAVLIRPCMSRGRRLRGLPPIYTPSMLEKHAGVFDGWPMFMDHLPPKVAETLAKHGRSVKELGGQVLKGRWGRDFSHPDDAQFGYQRGGVLAETWATPFVRKLVGENPNLLHTSINAWPTSGKPGPCPWRPAQKGMVIEGIRRQPQGSVDYVVRGGAGGRLLVAEGLEEEGIWPEVGEWSEPDARFVVSLAESFYAAREMEIELPNDPQSLKGWLQEHAPHLLPALEADAEPDADDKPKVRKRNAKQGGNVVDDSGSGMSEEDVRAILAESNAGQPTVEEFEQALTERFEQTLAEREMQRRLSEHAQALVERAEGIPTKWKADLKLRYATVPEGVSEALLVEGDVTGEDGQLLSEEQVIEARVNEDLDHVRELVAEAQGKPRVTGLGGGRPDPADGRSRKAETPLWRSRMVEMGLAESEDKAVEAFGGKVDG